MVKIANNSIPPIAIAMRERIGHAFELIHGDLEKLPKTPGETPLHHIAAVGCVALYDQENESTNACAFLSGRRDQVCEILARLCVEAHVNPMELIPIMVGMMGAKKKGGK